MRSLVQRSRYQVLASNVERVVQLLHARFQQGAEMVQRLRVLLAIRQVLELIRVLEVIEQEFLSVLPVEAGVACRGGRNPAGPAHQERHPHRFLAEDVFRPPPVRAHHFAVIDGEHHDGVVADAGFVNRLQQSADVPVQIGGHRIVNAHHLRNLLALARVFEPSPRIGVRIILRQVVRGQCEARRLPFVSEHLIILRGHVVRGPRVVRRADGQEQGKRLAGL